MITKFLRALFVGACLGAIAGALFFPRFSLRTYRLESLLTGLPLPVVIKGDIDELTKGRGSAAAVALISESVNRRYLSADDCHAALHLVGHRAYVLYGDNFERIFAADPHGICDSGYLHGVEAEILGGSADARSTLWSLCSAEYAGGMNDGPCFHGVGHSALEGAHDVPAALAICDSLKGGPETNLDNCYRGVFSELSVQMALAANRSRGAGPVDHAWEVSARDPYPYCSSFKSEYREACYTQLAQKYIAENIGESVRGCVGSSSEIRVQNLCIHIVVALGSRKHFDSGDLQPMANMIDAMHHAVTGAALDGVYEAYLSAGRTYDTMPSWDAFCAILTEQDTKDACTARSKDASVQAARREHVLRV